MMRWAVLSMLLMALSACTPAPPEDTASPPAESTEKGPSRVTAEVFPEAVEVRLFINPEAIVVDDSGHPNKGSFPRKGIKLTAKDLSTLRKSIYYTEPPGARFACCIPRHSFLFYDKKGTYLGQITVCFECDCIFFSGENPPSDKLSEVGWDYHALAGIVKAHGQKTTF